MSPIVQKSNTIPAAWEILNDDGTLRARFTIERDAYDFISKARLILELRDHFAIGALPTIAEQISVDAPAVMAENAYQIADAMLAARRNPEQAFERWMLRDLVVALEAVAQEILEAGDTDTKWEKVHEAYLAAAMVRK